jgi:hypothetical protein
VYDEEGNLLDEKPMDLIEVEKRKKISMVRNKLEDLIQNGKEFKRGHGFSSFKCAEHRRFFRQHCT